MRAIRLINRFLVFIKVVFIISKYLVPRIYVYLSIIVSVDTYIYAATTATATTSATGGEETACDGGGVPSPIRYLQTGAAAQYSFPDAFFPNLHRHRHSRPLLVRQYIVCGKLALGHIFREIYAAGIAEARSGIERLPRNGIQMGDEEVRVDDVHLVFARTGTAVGLLLVQELLHIGCNDAVVRQRTFDGYLYAVPPLLARKVCGGVAEKGLAPQVVFLKRKFSVL